VAKQHLMVNMVMEIIIIQYPDIMSRKYIRHKSLWLYFRNCF